MDRPKRSKKPRTTYDPPTIVSQWLATIPPEAASRKQAAHYTEETLAISLPKRFMVYEPMVLLSPGAFSEAAWVAVLDSSMEQEKESLYRIMLEAISKIQKSQVTHLAINAGIPLHVGDDGAGRVAGDVPEENVLRSPLEIVTLYGDFGPATLARAPCEDDLKAAFWVSTKQNGIFQTWAPRYTMFSRGNITEKARILDFHDGARSVAALPRRTRPPGDLRGRWAVDLYAGIGYFVFSYAKLGMRVLCWEINPWSVEGLRRGAVRNGWKVRVVCGEELARPTCDLVGDEQIVVFVEDNQKARGRIESLRSHLGDLEVLHVNGGLLPTSKDTWAESWEVTSTSAEAWLHLHENVGEDDVETRRGHIQDLFDEWATRDGHERRAEIEHVEKVKTIAPRVWHCVFDVYITRLSLLSKESQ